MVERVRREPLPVLVTLGLGVVLGAGIAWASGSSEAQPSIPATTTTAAAAAPTPTPTTTASAQPTSTQPAPPSLPIGLRKRDLLAALKQGVTAAEALGGTAQAAAWVQEWRGPAVVGGASPFRMWSMSKPVTAIAVLQREPQPSPDVWSAMTGAITGSENCRQRRVVLELQRLSRGVGAGREAFAQVLTTAGASARTMVDAAAPEGTVCTRYLQRTVPTGSVWNARALQLGTVEWTVQSAVTFGHALGGGAYGAAGEQVLALMRRPKRASREADPPLTVDPAFGFGKALAGFRPAYKGGWGGHATGTFVAAQFGVVDVAGHTVSLAVVFKPTAQPPDDDPGHSSGPKALEAMLAPVAEQFRRAQG